MIEIKQSINDDSSYVTGLTNDSRLNMFNAIKNDESEYYFNIFKNYTMPDELKNDDRLFNLYMVDNDDWWDNISAHWYDTTELWWLICFTNDITNPYEEIYEGMTIKIFRKEYYNIVMQSLEDIYKL